MRWLFLRAAVRQIPFLLGRAFEVAIVLSLVCLMFGGVFVIGDGSILAIRSRIV